MSPTYGNTRPLVARTAIAVLLLALFVAYYLATAPIQALGLGLALASTLAVVVLALSIFRRPGAEASAPADLPADPAGKPPRREPLGDPLPPEPPVAPAHRPDDGPLLPPSDADRFVQAVGELTELVAVLDRQRGQVDEVARPWLDYLIDQVTGVLVRCDVELIDSEAAYRRARHEPVGSAAMPAEGQEIVETIRPGFALGRRVLLRARVRLKGVDD